MADGELQAAESHTKSREAVEARGLASLPLEPLALGLMIVAGVCGWLMEFAPWAWARVANPFFEGEVGDPATFTLPIYGPTLSGLGPILRALHLSKSLAVLFFSVAQFSTVIGVIVGVALIARLRPRVRLALLIIYTLWVIVLLPRTLFFTAEYLSGALATPVGVGAAKPGAQALWVALAGGYWFAWLAIALGSVGCLLLWRPVLADLRRPWPATTRRGWAERAGAAVVTLGAGVWIAGFFTLPWVTQGCSQLHFSLLSFSNGVCSGLDASDVIIRAPLAQTLHIRAWYGPSPGASMGDALRLLWTTEAFYLLLALLVLWALQRVWFGAAGARRYGWPLTWLAVALVIAALATLGSQYDLRDPLALGAGSPDPWVYGPGLAVALAGLLIAAAGLALAYARAHLTSSPSSAV